MDTSTAEASGFFASPATAEQQQTASEFKAKFGSLPHYGGGEKLEGWYRKMAESVRLDKLDGGLVMPTGAKGVRVN